MDRPDARVIGAGRAGGAISAALVAAGWSVDGPLGRDHDTEVVATGVGIVILAVPDESVAAVAAAIEPGDAVIVHLAGSLGLDALRPHRRVASVHPLVSLPDPEVGAVRLRNAWFAVAGDSDTTKALVDAVDGKPFEIADADRAAYHAGAAIAANHLVALLAQVARVADSVGVPLEAYLDLARGALENVAAVGPAAALTGPVARDDWATVARHLEALPDDERSTYAILADAARRLLDGATS